MNINYDYINYEYWQKAITRAQIIMGLSVFIVEIVVNAVLYATRSQGYDPDTIADKLVYNLLLTTLFNAGVIAASFFCGKYLKSNQIKKYILIFELVLICFNTALSHYEFTPVFMTFIVPILFTIMYEDKRMCKIITALSMGVLTVPIIIRGLDPQCNVDIIPKAIISFAILMLACVFSEQIITVLESRKIELKTALAKAEKVKYIDELNKKNKELELLSNETFEAIAKAIDVNDPYTAGHSRRVAKYSKMIAKRLGFSADDLEEVYYAGLIHDVGKLGIDNQIINKCGKLSDEEFNEIKKHPVMGYEILKNISIRGHFAYGAKWHHERIDGKGYPDGLKGDEIPEIAKIIAVADAYDAMTSRRTYRGIMSQESVREQIVNGIGKQFDASIASIMLSLIDSDKDYSMKQDSYEFVNLNHV